MDMVEGILLTIITAATPLIFAAIGELVAERSGVLNLGLEGMMAVGAVAGFAAASLTGVPAIGVFAAPIAGALAALIFAVATLVFAANQVASGLALTILGLGLANLLGSPFIGVPGKGVDEIQIPLLSDLPFVGTVVFGLDPLTYLAIALAVGVWWFLFRTRAGLVVRAVGDNHASAHALGYRVIRVRFLATMFGGACAGLGGAYLSLVYTPQWIDNMTAGRGWIALALVVFASWLPGRVVIGAVLFGGVSILQLHAQAIGFGVPSQFLTMLPYLTTIVVLVLISRNVTLLRVNTPACLGISFVPDR
jgi:simple sugar transport system permease protein